ncbi:MAG: glycosyltransferase family 2 protein [Gammaproteobacteria bacterium]|nr:glycosyltransferase family 2 protein [Gammaproteobacteria bacterium]
MSGSDGPLDVSVVVPVYNEVESVGALVEEIAAALAGRSYEMIFVDDASRDGTADALRALKAGHPTLRVLRHGANAGQSRAVRTGVLAARAPVVATLDGDGQNDPADLPALIDALTRPHAPPKLAMVGGRRARRQDSAWKRLGSRVGNGVRRRLLRDQADDTGCGIKAFRREAFVQLPYFDHLHRFLPALMLREGYEIAFADVSHRPRRHGRSKYSNIGRLLASLSDLLGVMWLLRRARRPGDVEEV